MTLKSGEYPWIIMDANKDPRGKQKFVCIRCGQEHAFTVDGLSIDSFLSWNENKKDKMKQNKVGQGNG